MQVHKAIDGIVMKQLYLLNESEQWAYIWYGIRYNRHGQVIQGDSKVLFTFCF